MTAQSTFPGQLNILKITSTTSTSPGCTPPTHLPQRHHPLTNDPDQHDPRPLDRAEKPCCSCNPDPPPTKLFDLKLKKLHDCYWCCPSKECIHAKKVHCDRWKLYCSKRNPDCESIFCGGSFIPTPSLSEPAYCDFTPVYVKAETGPRQQQLEQSMVCQAVEEAENEIRAAKLYPGTGTSATPVLPPCPIIETILDEGDRMATYYTDDAHTYWYAQIRSPKRFVEGTSPAKDLLKPFRKNSSFTNSVLEY